MASKRRLQRSSCTGKLRYASQGQAKIAVRHILKKRTSIEGKLNCYKCPFCNGWHVGHAHQYRQDAS